MTVPTRRHVLAATAVSAGAAALPTAARAFSFSESNVATRELYENACGQRAFHDELIAEVRQVLGEKGYEASEAEVRAAVRSLSCPVCGCPLTAALPDSR